MCIIQFLIDANTANMQVGFPLRIANISVCCHSKRKGKSPSIKEKVNFFFFGCVACIVVKV